MKHRKRLLITIAVGVVLIIAFYYIAGYLTQVTGYSVLEKNVSDNSVQDSSFVDCLKKQDIQLYINSENTNQALEATGLTDYLEAVKIHNCNTDATSCTNLGISSTQWMINNQKVQIQSADDLAKYTGCKLN